jgi:hypothetical protein
MERRLDVKKGTRKLVLQKETIAYLQSVVAGVLQEQSRVIKTTDTAGGNVSQTCGSVCVCQA